MATVNDLFAALKKADEAGNAEDASQIAEILNGIGFGQRPIPKAPEPEPKLKDYIKDIPKALGGTGKQFVIVEIAGATEEEVRVLQVTKMIYSSLKQISKC